MCKETCALSLGSKWAVGPLQGIQSGVSMRGAAQQVDVGSSICDQTSQQDLLRAEASCSSVGVWMSHCLMSQCVCAAVCFPLSPQIGKLVSCFSCLDQFSLSSILVLSA